MSNDERSFMLFRKKKEDSIQAELQRINDEAVKREKERQLIPTDTFRMIIEDVFSITGRGTVVTGKVETGRITVGNNVHIESKIYEVKGIEMFRKTCKSAEAGDIIGLLIDASKEVKRGQLITT